MAQSQLTLTLTLRKRWWVSPGLFVLAPICVFADWFSHSLAEWISAKAINAIARWGFVAETDSGTRVPWPNR